ncbi:hypothetical protein Poli38472_002640 [Pythium oligandrum]|uniref:Ketoreductase domain-containing protein n=1 Tax=Pythium oligandrum TaxID=41045 RepID=A0A8K1CHJ7_PYTOL|nr:hypothetical protein Poli38472_002640 [Pythium oligandrum]|eukprot:TMW63699.1 hypothetical protein Poli38472_002640 [Pythium oligandrum]
MATDTVPVKWDATRIQSLHDKLAIVTGANSGIGYETALELARKGARVVLACRHEGRGNEAVKKLQEALAETPGAGPVEFMQLDVSDMSSVKRFSDEFKKTHDRLDMLINNAGVMAIPYAETVDGFEAQFATNHLGHFVLTAQLFDLLQASAPSRIVNVSSVAHRTALTFNEDNIMPRKEKYDQWQAYAISKLSNILFTKELARRFEANGITGVTAAVCHPGSTDTNLISAPTEKSGWLWSTTWKFARALPIYQTAPMGALPTLYAATAPGVKNGQYFGPRGFQALWGYPALEEPTKQAKSESAAQKLWELSERLTNTPFPIGK